jgi:hypothetical protein
MNHSQSILARKKTGSVLLLFLIVAETVNEHEQWETPVDKIARSTKTPLHFTSHRTHPL